jgi:hypothetical protein
MIKNLVKLLAICSCLIVAAPASATLYTYTMNDGTILKIDNVKNVATLKSKDGSTNLVLKDKDFSKFKGVFQATEERNKNSFTLDDVTGKTPDVTLPWTYQNNDKYAKLIFDFDPAGTKQKHVRLVFYTNSGGSYTNPQWSVYKDISYGVKSEAVPEPENLALLLIGLVGLFFSTRKRKSQQNEGGVTGQLQPA